MQEAQLVNDQLLSSCLMSNKTYFMSLKDHVHMEKSVPVYTKHKLP